MSKSKSAIVKLIGRRLRTISLFSFKTGEVGGEGFLLCFSADLPAPRSGMSSSSLAALLVLFFKALSLDFGLLLAGPVLDFLPDLGPAFGVGLGVWSD